MTTGIKWINYMTDERDQKIYDRNEINKLVSRFYKNLYSKKENRMKEGEKLECKYKIEEVEEEIPEILYAEVETVVKSLKMEKSAGTEGITNEQIKYGGEMLIKHITKLINKIVTAKKIPKQWDESDIKIIYKKGDRHKITNYRPICITSTMAKIFSKVISNRIKRKIYEQQPIEQAGFRKGFTTTDHLQVINQLIEKAKEYNRIVYLAFIDYKKAFDTINHEFMMKSLRNQGIEEGYVRIIKEMYKRGKARVITDKRGECFKVERGIKQGDPLSSLIFIAALEEIFKKLKWQKKRSECKWQISKSSTFC